MEFAAGDLIKRYQTLRSPGSNMDLVELMAGDCPKSSSENPEI
jgi:hypothetical protein